MSSGSRWPVRSLRCCLRYSFCVNWVGELLIVTRQSRSQVEDFVRDVVLITKEALKDSYAHWGILLANGVVSKSPSIYKLPVETKCRQPFRWRDPSNGLRAGQGSFLERGLLFVCCSKEDMGRKTVLGGKVLFASFRLGCDRRSPARCKLLKVDTMGDSSWC